MTVSEAVASALRRLVPESVDGPPPLVVALSGGLDSCVLLHALLFAGERRRGVVAAHYDHGMRRESRRDADWVRGLCRAWRVELFEDRADAGFESEAAARDARYAFLNDVRRRLAHATLLTAHHADDQAETVLFRALRGTGIEGLAGIPEAREPGIVRPLLGVWREELEAYARRVGLSWREDATNEHLGFARNALRHRILPEVESRIAPGARRALVRLAEIASDEEAAWSAALDVVEGAVGVSAGAGASSLAVDRDRLLALGPPLAARVLRRMARRFGPPLDADATRRAVEFACTGRSAGRIELGDGIELRRELDRLVVGPPADEPPPDRAVTIERPDAGSSEGRLGGRAVWVQWGGELPDAVPGPADTLGLRAGFRPAEITFPLLVRARRPGDRIELAGGTRKVNAVLLDARIPPGRRDRIPLLVDADETVLWIPGVAAAEGVILGAEMPPGLLWISIGGEIR